MGFVGLRDKEPNRKQQKMQANKATDGSALRRFEIARYGRPNPVGGRKDHVELCELFRGARNP